MKRRINVLTHSPKGIFIAYGKDIKKGKADTIKYYDIIPTILKLFDMEKQEQKVGR